MKTKEEIKEACKSYTEKIYGATAINRERTAVEDAFIGGAEFAAPKWIPVSERLPQPVEKKMYPVLGLSGKHRVICYYFPEHFKSVEWEDWDDYCQQDFPYTEEDNEKCIVWLRPGFYQEVECDRCDGYWNSPLPITCWQPLPEPPIQ